MKKHLFILLLIIFFGKISNSDAQVRLSEQANISLLTCSPGGEIYSLFGHSAIRVSDPRRKMDLVFNYGIFDFDAPNFTLNFIQGKLTYKLGLEQYRRFHYQYNAENRQVTEQIFNLNPEEKQQLFDFLRNNARPENRDYEYDFFFNNCSNRIENVLQEVLGKNLTYTPPQKEYLTFRNQLDYYTDGKKYPASPWVDFGMDLILGIPSEKIADFKGEMFLPDHLSENFTFGKIHNSIPLVQPNRIIIPQKKPSSVAHWIITPSFLFWILCGFTGLLFLVKNNTFTKIFDFIFFLLLGLSGLLFVLMWTATDHHVCHQNINILWMIPTHILLTINILRNNLQGFWKKYLWVTLIVNILLILFWKILPQEFHLASFPIILMVMMRTVALLKMDS